jgi:hypothetical protein
MIGAASHFRPDPFRDLETTTVLQLVIQEVNIEWTLIDRRQGIRNGMAGLNSILLRGKHGLDDSTNRDVVINYQNAHLHANNYHTQ